MTGALRIVQRNALVYRHAWRGSLFFSFLQPTLFLIAMGFGLGAFVDRGAAAIPGGVSFLAFLAPGLLASSLRIAAILGAVLARSSALADAGVRRSYLPLRLSVRVKPKWRLCQRESALSAENPSRSATSVRLPLLPSR